MKDKKQKKTGKVAGRKTKPLVEKDVAATDGVNDVAGGGNIPSHNAGKCRIKRHISRKISGMTNLAKQEAMEVDVKSKMSLDSQINGSASSSEEAPREDCAVSGHDAVKTNAVTWRVSTKKLKPRIRYLLVKSFPGSKGISSRLQTSIAIRKKLSKVPSGSKGYGDLEALTKEELLTIIRKNKLNSKDKKVLMSHLRHNLLSGQSELSDLRKQASTESRLPERAKSSAEAKILQKMKKRPGMTAYEIQAIEAADLRLVPLEKPQPPVPNLAYGLERVLFNPGVYHLQDPRSRVFNFDPYLESIMPVAEFDFDALKEYITSSRDETLISTAAAEHKKYTGSTSSMTPTLAHFHYLLSQWRPINISSLSKGFPETLRSFTQLQRSPAAIFLRWRNGTYAIDADKEFDSANVLMMLGKSMEKLLTLPMEDFEKYRKENSDQISKEQRNEAESFHYTTMGDFLMRSQLDAHDPRIPGTGMFDLKTRAVVSIRMDARNYHDGLGYEIRSRHGAFESYEREYYDMIRAAFLKYSLQVRMGRMDGIFVAFHNTERIFGFQYISLPEMDFALHGQDDLIVGDSEFKLSLGLLNRILDRATAKFPNQSLRLFFETRETSAPFMYIFAEPVTEDDIQRIQNSKKAEIEEYERTVLGRYMEKTPEEVKDEQRQSDWEELQAKVEESMDDDEIESLDEDDNLNEVNEHSTGGESSGHNGLPIHEIQPDSTSLSDEGLIGLKSEMEETCKEGADFEGIFGEHIMHHKVIEDGEKEQNLEQALRLDGEGEEGQEATGKVAMIEEISTGEAHQDVQDAREQTGRARDAHEDTNQVMDQPTAENLVTEAPVDSQSEFEDTSESSKSDLLAMTLTIRNKVNGEYVVRPENLGSKDRWTVEYALAEVPDQDQARTLYEKTQRRRAVTLKRDKNYVKSSFTRAYARKIQQISLRGRKWREEQNEIDRKVPVKVLGDQIAEAQLDGAPR